LLALRRVGGYDFAFAGQHYEICPANALTDVLNSPSLAPVLTVSIVVVVALSVSVNDFYLPADLAACRVGTRVYIDIGSAGTDERNDRWEITSSELLICHAPRYNVRSRDRSGEIIGPRVTGMSRWTWIRRRLTQPDHDTAIHA
jgi:hypothetical protein